MKYKSELKEFKSIINAYREWKLAEHGSREFTGKELEALVNHFKEDHPGPVEERKLTKLKEIWGEYNGK